MINSILAIESPRVAYKKLIKLYLNSDVATRNSIRAGWDFNREWSFPDMSNLCTLDENAEALCIYIIDESLAKQRESLIGLCAIYNSLTLLGHNPDIFFKEMAQKAGEPGRKMLIDFVNRDAEDKTLEAFGWREAPKGTPNKMLISPFE